MLHLYQHATHLAHDRRQQARISRSVGVAVHGLDGCDQRELVENLIAADIARVENELDTAKCIVNPRTQLTVRIGDESDDVNAVSPSHHASPSGSARQRLPSE